MNLVPVEGHAENGKATLRKGDFRVEVPERLLSAVSGQGNRPLIVGLRPEHLEVANGDVSDAARIPAVVDVVEYLGDEQLVHLHAGEVELIAKLPIESRLSVGQDVKLAVPIEKLYLFDAETEAALKTAG